MCLVALFLLFRCSLRVVQQVLFMVVQLLVLLLPTSLLLRVFF